MADPAEPALIAVLDDYQQVAASLADWGSLGSAARMVAFHDHVEDPDQLAARLRPFQVCVLMRERTPFDAELIARLPNLRLILTMGMANASIDMAAARARGIAVCGTEPKSPNATPELAWGLVLALARNIVGEAASLRAGGWQLGLGTDLSGRTLGLLGLGRIGQVMARYGAAFGMRCIAWSQNLTDEQAGAHGAERVEKDALFTQSDIVSIHVRLSQRTQGLVGARELGLMKRSAYLVNTSRGPIVSEPDLIAALRERRIAGAALDVFDQEPLPPDHPFRHLPNVLATPHIGYVSQNTYRDAFPQFVEDIRAWLGGQPIRQLPG